ncbi:PhzF family phenazine biosynthesis protein [Yunchengibacter salinarum]|uniref:PhzF family phenazine biosynthesis protein n=1 Tax=Yunchengibacter salinarum TaxID=3133399 RepID=UPI0035B60DC3
MQEIQIYQVDAFAGRAFGGNPAAVCPLETFLDDSVMQAIARENNLSETAFITPSRTPGADYDLRWFTPTLEVAICGHATLAAAHVVLTHLKPDADAVTFETRSGALPVCRRDGRLEMNFPVNRAAPVNMPPELPAVLGAEPVECYLTDREYLLVFEDAETIRSMAPSITGLQAMAPYGFIVTAPGAGVTAPDLPGKTVDFVSRCFYPNHGVPEDPVTGSAHCVSAPYWADRLGKDSLFALQVSQRGGELWLEMKGDRVLIGGVNVEVMRGSLFI